MDRALGPARLAEDLVGAVGDHLVGVHVRLGAGTGLPDRERELGVELAVDDLLRGRDDRRALLRIELAHRHVGLGAGALDDAERAHDRQRLLLPADLEVLQRALGLRAPIVLGRDLDRPEGVGLGAGGGHEVPGVLRLTRGGLAVNGALARPQTVKPWFEKGRARMRLPAASNTALASAGATPGTPGSPAPPISASGLSNSVTSTLGAWRMRKSLYWLKFDWSAWPPVKVMTSPSAAEAPIVAPPSNCAFTCCGLTAKPTSPATAIR